MTPSQSSISAQFPWFEADISAMLAAAGPGFRETGTRQDGGGKNPHVGAKNAAVNATCCLHNIMLDSVCTVCTELADCRVIYWWDNISSFNLCRFFQIFQAYSTLPTAMEDDR